MARPAYAYAAGAVVSGKVYSGAKVTIKIGGKVVTALNGPVTWTADRKLQPGDRVRRRGDGYPGVVIKNPDGRYRVTFQGGVIDGAGRTDMTQWELDNEFEAAYETVDESCDHDIKVYDSGLTRERYCTKCTWKEKL